MKLSKHQLHVIKRMQEGWELGTYYTQIGFTRIVETAHLQKHGLGHGDPSEYANVRTIHALVRKGFIKSLSNRYTMTQTTRYRLTEKGKEVKVK